LLSDPAAQWTAALNGPAFFSYSKPRTGVTAEGTRLYFASKKDCGVCHLKTRYSHPD
jgi:hypothetical protein